MFRSSRRFADDPRLDWLLITLAALLTLIYIVGAQRIMSSWNPDLKDYTMWYDHIVQNGRWRSLNGSFASYSPPYIYVLCIASNLDRFLQPVTVLKLLNVPFILASGYLGFSICRALGCTQRRSAAAGWIIMVAPEIVANALVWGQTDILETTFVLLLVRLLLARRPGWAMAAAGVALSFKLQVIFLGPAILTLLITQELPVWSLLCAAAGYVLMMLPAELAGRSYQVLWGVYSAQSGAADRIDMGAANLYTFVVLGTGNGRVDAHHPFFLWLVRFGVVFAAVLTVFLIRYLFKHKPLLQQQKPLLVLAISALAEPFLLPKMHDRYFYMGDVLVLLLGFLLPRMLLPAALLQIASLMVYARYLIGFAASSWYYVVPAILIAGAIGLLLRELQRESTIEAGVSARDGDLANASPGTF